MIKLSGSVGRMGLNRKHDVALVQKIMSLIKVRTKFGPKPIWSKRIDGRYTREMEPAIMCLQEHIGQKPTGKLECTAQTMNALTRALPLGDRNLLAIEGTIAVASPGTANRPAERIARETEAKAPFPKRERKALAAALMRVGKESGFCLKRQQDYVTADGRFASQLAFDITTVPEAGSGREVERALTKIVEAAPGWSAIAGGRLAFI